MISVKKYEEFVKHQTNNKFLKTFNKRLGLAGLGLSGESGECSDLAKKVLFHGMKFTEEVRQKMIKELGDVAFYLTFAALLCDVSLMEVMDGNYKKLKERFKSGAFTSKEALVKERLTSGKEVSAEEILNTYKTVKKRLQKNSKKATL